MILSYISHNSKQSSRRTCAPDQTVMERLCSGSSGDIRSAINSLQFSSNPGQEKIHTPHRGPAQWLLLLYWTTGLKNSHCFTDGSSAKGLWRKDSPLTSSSKAVSRPNLRKKKSKKAKEREEEQAIGGKDACLFLFRALGKILHCKRESCRPVSYELLIYHVGILVESLQCASKTEFKV